MQKSRFAAIAAAFALALPALGGPANAADTKVWGGANFKADQIYAGTGFITANNGDLTTDGWLMRGIVGYGNYDYFRPGKINGQLWEFDVTIGYQIFTDTLRFAGYAGVNYQHHGLSQFDPTNSTRGGTFGFKALGEVETLDTSPVYASGAFGYSTANKAYWGRARLGANLGGFRIGPEGVFQGNDEYDDQRYGGFVLFGLGGNWSADLSAGYADVGGLFSRDSAYGQVGLSVLL